MLTKNKSRNIERLLYLASEVAKTKPDRKVGSRPPFYFGNYADYEKWDGKNQKLSCGTTACAIGLASTLPKFRRLGLRLIKFGIDKGKCSYDFNIQPCILGGEYANDRYDAWKDVATVLGLTTEEYYALFVPDSHPVYLSEEASPQEVANNIRSFCKAAKRNKEEEWLNS